MVFELELWFTNFWRQLVCCDFDICSKQMVSQNVLMDCDLVVFLATRKRCVFMNHSGVTTISTVANHTI